MPVSMLYSVDHRSRKKTRKYAESNEVYAVFAQGTQTASALFFLAHIFPFIFRAKARTVLQKFPQKHYTPDRAVF